ncbi:hypothetical protein MMC21_004441 [Puttea exsequens]|nr:hypothetical protein [Puttea exsequens]
MSSGYGRPLSPPRNRYHPPGGPPGRISAGSFFSTSAYDPYGPSSRTSREHVSGPRISDERVGGGSRLVPLRARSPPRRAAADDYVVAPRPRPRRATLEPEAPQRIRRPVSMIDAGPTSRSSRPIITSAADRPPSPVTKVRRERRDEDYEVLPASSSSRRHHQRHSSLGLPEGGRLVPVEREPTAYRVPTTKPTLRERRDENDRDYGYEYTDPRDTKPQDPSYRQRSRRDSYNNARPASMIMEGYIPRSNREHGPPVTTRGFENIERSQGQRQGYRSRDDEKVPGAKEYVRDDREIALRKAVRPEIALHQPSNDGYNEEELRHHRPRKSTPDDDRLEKARPRPAEDEKLESRPRDVYDDQTERPRRHRHKHHRHPDRHRDDDKYRDADGKYEEDHRAREERRRERRERREREERIAADGSNAGVLAGAGTAAAATGLAAEGLRRHHDKGHTREEDNIQLTRRSEKERDRDHLAVPDQAFETSSTTSGPSTAEDSEYQEAREAAARAKVEAEHFVGPVEPEIRKQASYERRPEPDYTRHHRTYRPRRHHSRTRDEDSYSSSSSSSSSDSEDDNRQRQVRVVSPANEDKPPPLAPKSILRKPRDKFPEHPTTVREGVAPHKDAMKKDIPPNARWTKIDRRFVNPESLEQDGIRFNEYDDHVIVLKVMDLEEIEKYTRKTAEIRANRRMLMGPPETSPSHGQSQPHGIPQGAQPEGAAF